MSFLSGWTIAIAAGLTIPPLVALYFLKLKRRVEPIPSTLLWKRAVQDLHVNAPFQRLRRNLLMLLQLLVLLLAAIALGKPIIQAPQTHEGTIILLIDHSASMNVIENDGRTRLEIAKEQARRTIANMKAGTRAMIVSFADKAAIVSPFDTDKAALKAKIDAIEPSQSISTLSEAIALAEAHASNLVIGTEDDAGGLVAPDVASGGNMLLFTDGRIEDAADLNSQRFRAHSIEVINVAERTDNVGITSMLARRHYEEPEQLEVLAEVRNFGTEPVELDATLLLEGKPADVQTVRLEPGWVAPRPGDDTDGAGEGEDGEAGAVSSKPKAGDAPRPGSVASIAFDELTYGGGGVVEVELRVDDALKADNRAWAVIQPPRSTDVLLVTDGNYFLERVLATLPIRVRVMTPAEYESPGSDRDLLDGRRSLFDVVIFDRHSTDKLPPGNYLFWEGVPEIDGVALGDPITNEIIVNWDETHPILRHVAVESIQVIQWRKLAVPPEAVSLIDGETGPVLAYLTREGRQYLLCAFALLVDDPDTGRPLLNTFWVTQTHFPMFMYNAVQYLSSSLTAKGMKNVQPGQPVLIPVAEKARRIKIRRPDGGTDDVDTIGTETVPYARTRRVGVYEVTPGVPGQDRFAVNLFSHAESNVAPNTHFTIGADVVASTGGVDKVNKPIWPWLLVAALVVVLLEWTIYNKRVLV